MASRIKASEVTFYELQSSVLCVECEVISYNNGPYCLACGSQAVLSLSRVLGGSLRGQPRAQRISDAALERVVEDLLRDSESASGPASSRSPGSQTLVEPSEEKPFCPDAVTLLSSGRNGPHAPMVEIEPGIAPYLPSMVAGALARAYQLTHAGGAALAVYDGGRFICSARLGETAPDLGVEAGAHTGLSGLCLRTGRVWRCAEADTDSYAHRDHCRRLGAQSIVAAPLLHLRNIFGMLEVLSPERAAFSDNDVASVQLLAELMVVGFVRASRKRQLQVSKPLPPAGNLNFLTADRLAGPTDGCAGSGVDCGGGL